MTRNIKALSLALVAAFAMSVVAASGAQAAEFTGFETEGSTHKYVHTILHATSESEANGGVQKFKAGIGTVECYHYEGEATSETGKSASLTVSANYFGKKSETNATDCETSGTWTTHVNMNGCHYTFHPGEKVAEDKYKGTADLVCGTGGLNGPITINITKVGSTETKCTVKIAAQNNLGPVYFYNKTESKPTDVTVESAVEGIHYTSEGGLLNCGVSNGEHADSTYNGNVTAQAFNTAGAQIDAEVSG